MFQVDLLIVLQVGEVGGGALKKNGEEEAVTGNGRREEGST